MQFLTLLIILAVTLASFFADQFGPSLLKFLPECLSGLVLIYVVLTGPRQRFQFVAARFWIAFGAAALFVFCGVIANSLAPGPLISGLRFYIRAIPMFFLPAVFPFTPAQIWTQLRLLCAISLVQLPLSVYQRYAVLSHGRQTGDPVFGTLMISSIMSVFLIGGMCIATALTLRGRLSKLKFICLFVLFTIPTTINETKGTVILLPVGLITTLLVGSEPRKRLRILGSAVALMAVFAALFVPIYDYFARVNNPYPYTVEGFFSDPKWLQKYLDPETDLGSRKGAGRIDSMVVPLQTFTKDPIHLLLGVGIGNGSPSSLGKDYTGEYNELLGRYTAVSSASAFLVEIGLLGLGVALLLEWFVFRDALWVARHDDSLFGTLALGWSGMAAVMIVGTFYRNLHAFESLSYLFWYFSGLVCAQRMRLTLALQQTAIPERAVRYASQRMKPLATARRHPGA